MSKLAVQPGESIMSSQEIEAMASLKLKVFHLQTQKRDWAVDEVVLIPLPDGLVLPKHDCSLTARGLDIPSLAFKSDLQPRCGRCFKALL